MYSETNNYNVYTSSFSFPISKGISKISIDCTSNGVVYPTSDVAQGIACMGTGTIVTGKFELFENSNIILIDYLNNNNVSFGHIEINEISVDNTNLFSSKETMQEFYVSQAGFILLVIILIFIQKLLGRR